MMSSFARRLALAACCLLGVLAAAGSLNSCDRRPLEVYWQDEARLVLHVDWNSWYRNRPEWKNWTGFHPNGMTVLFYDDSGALCRSFSTNDVDSTRISMPVGRYRMVIFNRSLSEFSSFHFTDYQDFLDFRTTASEALTRRNVERWDKGTPYFWEPDELLAVAVDSFEVTHEMVEHQLKFIDYHYRNDVASDTTIYHLREMAHPMQTVIHIRVHVWGLENMYSLEANLDGMADGCSMTDMWRNNSTCVVYYSTNKWSYNFDGDASAHGWVTIDIPTWGEPHGKELQEWRDSTDNVLRMNFTLLNNEERYWEFNVGHLIYYKDSLAVRDSLTRPDVLRHLYLEINREIPLLPETDDPVNKMGAGFDAHVDPWEWGGTVDLGTF